MQKYSNMYFNILIMDILEENDIQVKSFEDGLIKAKYGDINIEICHERCLCHGGRLTIISKHCEFYKRIEHEEYDGEKGITDEDTELEYEIKNEMIPIIKALKTYVYKCKKIKPFYEGHENRENITYYSSVEDLSYAVLEEKGVDVFTLNESYTYQCPNPDIKYIITPISYTEGILKLEKQRWYKKDGEWMFKKDGYDYEEIYCSIFKKDIK